MLIGVLVRESGPIWPDLPVTEALQSLSPSLDGTMRAISAIGSIPGVAATGGVVVLALLRRRRFRDAALVAASGSAELVTLALRFATDRPRPSPLLVQVIESGPGTSFPSGHAADAAALAIIVAHLIRPDHDKRLLLWGGLALYAAVNGISRVYLGAHWLSDVIGGYLAGGAIGLALGGFMAGRQE